MHPTRHRAVRTVGVQRLSCGTNARIRFVVVVEMLGPELTLWFGRTLVLQRMGVGFVFALIGKAFITLTHAVVGNQRIDLAFSECL